MICYKITNKINGKIYIGITQFSLHQRWLGHCGAARSKNPRGKFTYAIRKYGPDAFTMEVLYEAVNLQELCAVEKGLIAQYGPEYNVAVGGRLGGPWKEEQKAGMRRRMAKQMAQPGNSEEMGKRASLRWSRMTHEERCAISQAIWNKDQRAKMAVRVQALWNDPVWKKKELARRDVVTKRNRFKKNVVLLACAIGIWTKMAERSLQYG